MATDFATESITPEQLAMMPYDKNYELVDGQLVERKMGNKSAWIALELAHYLREYVLENRWGWVFGAEAGYRLNPDRPLSVRKPDVSCVRFGKLPKEEPADTYDNVVPDLAVEVVSPNDTVLELEEKLQDYFQAGVGLVWVINPELKILTVRRPDGSGCTVRNSDDIDGEFVLPGFRLQLSKLFDMPKP